MSLLKFILFYGNWNCLTRLRLLTRDILLIDCLQGIFFFLEEFLSRLLLLVLFCGVKRESLNHIFFSCCVSSLIWKELAFWVGIFYYKV